MLFILNLYAFFKMTFLKLILMHCIVAMSLELQAPFEQEKKYRDEEMAKLSKLPEWKRNLILKKRGENA